MLKPDKKGVVKVGKGKFQLEAVLNETKEQFVDRYKGKLSASAAHTYDLILKGRKSKVAVKKVSPKKAESKTKSEKDKKQS